MSTELPDRPTFPAPHSWREDVTESGTMTRDELATEPRWLADNPHLKYGRC
jgi:hypothetical protein